MKLRLWALARKATRYSRLTIPYCGRGWLALDERDLIQTHVLNDGLYEPEVWDALFSIASQSEVVWDIGAHIGTFAVRSMLDARVAFVHAFEPDPLTRRALQLNVDLNSDAPAKCSIHEMAIGADSGNSVLHRGPIRNVGLSSIVTQPTNDAFVVRRTSMDELVFKSGFTPPTLVKIDVEGAERDVVAGGSRVFRECKPKAVVIEANANVDGTMTDPSVVVPLGEAGYALKWIRRPNGAIWPRENYLALVAASVNANCD
jgi:FkbM family methyltransferase